MERKYNLQLLLCPAEITDDAPCTVSLYIPSVQRRPFWVQPCNAQCCKSFSFSTALLSLRGRVVVSSGSPSVLLPHQQIIILSISQKIRTVRTCKLIKIRHITPHHIFCLNNQAEVWSFWTGLPEDITFRSLAKNWMEMAGNSWSNRVPNIGSWQKYHKTKYFFEEGWEHLEVFLILFFC